MRRVYLGAFVIGLLAAAAPAAAQTFQAPEEELGVTGPFGWNFGGTLNVPLSSTADRINVGGGFAAGLTYNVSPYTGLQFEYGGNWSTLKSGKLANNGVSGTASFQYFNLNVVVRPGRAGHVGFYLIGGGGLYYRYAAITKVTGTTIAPYCDPWLYYCSAVPVPATSVLGTRDSWDWGLDAGLGIAFAVAPPIRLYLEARYHYVFGPSFTDSSGVKHTADGQYLPITLGLRF
jgi:opacity protein-like surface antigen